METKYRPLTAKQKATIGILSKKAFDIAYENGLVESAGESKAKQFTTWRRQQQAEAVKCESLTKCNQGDYLPLIAHFQILTGQEDKAFNNLLKSQPANDNADPSDTQESRTKVIARIKQEIDGTKFKLGYVCAIARNKFRDNNLEFQSAPP